MILVYLLPALIGIAAIVQGGMNKQISELTGMGWTIFLNGVVFFVLSLGYVYIAPDKVPFRFKSIPPFSWWHVIPGVAGMIIVVGAPIAISRIGAFKTFIAIIAAQVIGSLLWDAYVESIPVTNLRITGAVAAFASALFVALNA